MRHDSIHGCYTRIYAEYAAYSLNMQGYILHMKHTYTKTRDMRHETSLVYRHETWDMILCKDVYYICNIPIQKCILYLQHYPLIRSLRCLLVLVGLFWYAIGLFWFLTGLCWLLTHCAHLRCLLVTCRLRGISSQRCLLYMQHTYTKMPTMYVQHTHWSRPSDAC